MDKKPIRPLQEGHEGPAIHAGTLMVAGGFRLHPERLGDCLGSLEAARFVGTRALLMVTASRHRQHSFGAFDEATVSVLVRQPDAPKRRFLTPSLADLYSGRLAVLNIWHAASTPLAVDTLRQQWGMNVELGQFTFSRRLKSQRVEVLSQGHQVFALTVELGRQFSLGRQKLCLIARSPTGCSRARWAGGWHDASLTWRGAQLVLGAHPMARRLAAMGLESPKRSPSLFGACIDALDGMMGVAENLNTYPN